MQNIEKIQASRRLHKYVWNSFRSYWRFLQEGGTEEKVMGHRFVELLDSSLLVPISL